MGRSYNIAALLLFFLFCFIATVASLETSEELGQNLAARKHKHSGFTAAECPGACQYRCSKTQYKKPCLFFCQKCCYTCKCVPPGTYANKEKCPCYNNWKTKSGGPKCP